MYSSSDVLFGDNFDHNQWNGKCEDTCHIGYSSKSEQFESQLEAMNNGELSSVVNLELQLSACNRIVSLLCNRLSTGHFQLVQLLNNLNQCGDSLSVTLSTLSQLNPHPSISDICSNVTSTHGQLKHIQSLLLSHEHDASDNLKIIYAFQQKLEERIKQCKIKAQNSLETAKHNAVQTDFISNNEQISQQTFSNPKPNGFKNPGEIRYETLLKYGLVNPRNVLNRTLKHSSFSEPDEPTKCELQEALLNALGQVDRLKKYRISQKTRIDQLQERLDHMGTELDSSVDAIRHHQKNYEAQKRRDYMEITHLRNQLAKTTALLEQFKLFFSKTNLNTSSLDQNMRVLIGNLLKSLHTNDELQDIDTLSIDNLKLKLSIAQNELTQLRLDMTRQREDDDCEASRLRGQLAEVSSDARALRMQLSRLISQNISSSKPNGLANTNSSDSSSCTNCQKLQRLNDVLQRKQSKMNPFPDLINHQRNTINHENFVYENSTSTKKAIHKPHFTDSSVQTDLLNAIPTTDFIQKVEIALDPIDGYDGVSAHLPVENCEYVQTESFIIGNDITSSETLSGEILVDESLKYGSANEPRILSEVEFNNLHVSNMSTPVSLMENNNEAVINSYQNSMLHSISDLKHDNFVSLNQSVSEDSLHSQLLQRVKGAEEEAIMAMDQLKASNAEFLTLKERLSHATVERAHLKATIEGLDEQVALLEDSLYERTQELHKCQILLVKYCPTYQKPVTPYSVGPEVPTSELSIKIHEPNNNYTRESAVFSLRGLLQSLEPKKSFLRSPSIKFKFLHQLIIQKDWLSVLLKLLVVRSQQLTSRISSGIKHTSLRLQSQPRPKPIFIFLIYFFFVHLMLLHCWLL
ncbi:unnamed protein product [Schistosoma rodhaini]|uniref:Uncharacterized protein n=1 Tax=Schistosoma rodhaini TaxID=6188 RepID=A0AA85FVZ0_9TREM|nr:unnamed protein product [Schistosoma rodhaini]